MDSFLKPCERKRIPLIILRHTYTGPYTHRQTQTHTHKYTRHPQAHKYCNADVCIHAKNWPQRKTPTVAGLSGRQAGITALQRRRQIQMVMREDIEAAVFCEQGCISFTCLPHTYLQSTSTEWEP